MAGPQHVESDTVKVWSVSWKKSRGQNFYNRHRCYAARLRPCKFLYSTGCLIALNVLSWGCTVSVQSFLNWGCRSSKDFDPQLALLCSACAVPMQCLCRAYALLTSYLNPQVIQAVHMCHAPSKQRFHHSTTTLTTYGKGCADQNALGANTDRCNI